MYWNMLKAINEKKRKEKAGQKLITLEQSATDAAVGKLENYCRSSRFRYCCPRICRSLQVLMVHHRTSKNLKRSVAVARGQQNKWNSLRITHKIYFLLSVH